MAIKFNPFNPHGVVAPGMFKGRGAHINIALRALFQTKNENPQHILFLGERGIGKSSLLVAIRLMATKGFNDPAAGDMDFLTISVDLAGCTTQLEIVRALGDELKRQIANEQALMEAAKSVWDWLSNWEVLGVSYNKAPQNIDPRDAATDLVEAIAKFCALSPKDGILILIDEADRPAESAGLGEFMKALTERLARRGCTRVLIAMAGLPSLLGKLRASHESAPRLFRVVHVNVLEPDDRKDVIEAGLDIANDKNELKTTIEPGALNLIADISEGYPHFIQQFAFCAFEADSDGTISPADVLNGAIEALQQLGDKYFSELYHTRTQSPEYRRVLDAMAKHGDRWIQKQTIIKESGVKESTMNNALRALRQRGAIVLDEARPGHYRMATRSFATWINAIVTTIPKEKADSPNLFEGD